jgi:hypothetical protein
MGHPLFPSLSLLLARDSSIQEARFLGQGWMNMGKLWKTAGSAGLLDNDRRNRG